MREIRVASESDRNLLVDLYLADVSQDRRQAEQFASDLLNHLRTILCIDDGKLVGTISWDIRGGLDDGVIELIGLGVSPEYRRMGIAGNLVDAVIETAKIHYTKERAKLRIVYLFMEKSNEGARYFYETLGFKEVAVIPALYPHDDAAVWTRHL